MSQEAKDKFFHFLVTLKPSRESVGMYIRLVVLLCVGVVSRQYGDMFSHIPYIPVALDLLMMYLVLHVSLHLISSFIIFVYKKKNRRIDDHEDNFTVGIKKLSRFAFILVFTLMFIDTVLIDLKELISSLAIATFLIGLVFKDYLLNFLNGVDIMFSGKIKLGEYIKVGDEKGKVKDLTFSHVELQTDTKDVVYVPNNFLKTKQVVNYSRSKVKNIFVDVVLDKGRFEYYKELKRMIPKKMVKEFPELLADESKVRIHFDSLEKESIKWSVEYILAKYTFEIENKLKNYTGEMIVEFFNHKDKLKEEKEKKEKAEEEAKK
jgi:small-conductance mechanosensitive channel